MPAFDPSSRTNVLVSGNEAPRSMFHCKVPERYRLPRHALSEIGDVLRDRRPRRMGAERESRRGSRARRRSRMRALRPSR